ncbi:MAG: M15 family metallopeptidase [Oscillospiraceae bacterium]
MARINKRKKARNITILCFALIIIVCVLVFCFNLIFKNGYIDNINYTSEISSQVSSQQSEIITSDITEETTDVTSDFAPSEIIGEPPNSNKYIQKNKSKWFLLLVNGSNKKPDGYEKTITLQKIDDEMLVDSRIYKDLSNMINDANKKGVLAKVTSSFRTTDFQNSLFESEVKNYLNNGYSSQAAIDMASKAVAYPQYSEHETGLAVDINSADTNVCTPWTVYSWLASNSYKYGFILRYPNNKTKITGTIYEPWHFRFVGKQAAQEIFESGLTLEEYIEKIENN